MCNCGKKRGTPERPYIAGVANGQPAVQVRLTVHYDRSLPGDLVWVTGSGVSTWVQVGMAELVE